MPSRRNEKWAIPSAFKGISLLTRHYSKISTIAKFPKRAVLLTAYDYMIQHVNFEKLSSTDEIARDADIRFGWRWVAARMIVREDDGRGTGYNC